jgi:hypothetical protein
VPLLHEAGAAPVARVDHRQAIHAQLALNTWSGRKAANKYEQLLCRFAGFAPLREINNSRKGAKRAKVPRTCARCKSSER